MREIEFRVWSIKDKMFIETDDYNRFYISIDGTFLYSQSKSVFYGWNDEYENMFYYVIEQYTGLKDRNDKEIYEGDIVDYCIMEKDQVHIAHRGYGTIIFAEQVAKYMIKDNEDNNCFDFKQVYCKNVEVLDNIHNNSKVLEVK